MGLKFSLQLKPEAKRGNHQGTKPWMRWDHTVWYQLEGAGNKKSIEVLEEDQFITLSHHHGDITNMGWSHDSTTVDSIPLNPFSHHPLTHLLPPPTPKKKHESTSWNFHISIQATQVLFVYSPFSAVHLQVAVGYPVATATWPQPPGFQPWRQHLRPER